MSHIRALQTLLARVGLGLSSLIPSILLSVIGTLFSVKFYGCVLELSRVLVKGALSENGKAFLKLLALCYGVALLRGVANYASELFSKSLTVKAANRIRQLLMARMLGFGKQFFDKTPVGNLQHLIQKSAGMVAEQLDTIHLTFSGLLLLCAYLGMMVWISAPLTAFVILLLVTLGPASRKVLARVRADSRESIGLQGLLVHRISEVISGIVLIKAFSTSAWEKKRFDELSEKESAVSLNRMKSMELARPIEDVTQVTTLILVSTAIYFISNTAYAFDTANVFVFIYLVMASINTFNALVRNVIALTKATTELDSLDLFFQDEGKIFVREGNTIFRALEKQITFKDVHFSYVPGTPVLKGLSFSIEKNKMTALVGPTGGGKTSIVNLLMRFYDSPEASIFVDGTDIREFTFESYLSRVAYVPQDLMLFDDTLRSNLLYGITRTVGKEELEIVLEKCCLSYLVQTLPSGLDTIVGPRGVKLSGGEKQRVSIARALLVRSDILILDEATSALDVITEQKIHRAITELAGHKTILVLAHRLSTLLKADKIVVIEDGKVAEEGSVDHLIAEKGIFHRYWETSVLPVAPVIQ